jgi:hypothetical protein
VIRLTNEELHQLILTELQEIKNKLAELPEIKNKLNAIAEQTAALIEFQD